MPMPTKPPAAAEAKLLAAKVFLPESVLSTTVKANAWKVRRNTLVTGGALVARIFMQKETSEEMRRLPGGAIGNFITVDSAKCINTVLPFSWVVVWGIKHLEARPQCWQYHGGRAKGFTDIDLKLVVPR